MNDQKTMQFKLFVGAIIIVLLCACEKPQVAATEASALHAEVMTVQMRGLRSETVLPGRIEAARLSEVRAQVMGIVRKRYFREGADIKAGAALFQIDPAAFQAALAQAEGSQAKAKAELGAARSLAERYAPLVELNAVSRQEFDNAQAALKAAHAQYLAASAEVQTAKINLGYTTVRAPISGRIGSALVTEGALVSQSDASPMAVIQQLDPIYADFKQPVSESLAWREALQNGCVQKKQYGGIDLSLSVGGKERGGQLLFSDISVDKGTGQVLLRGRFPNKDAMLLPGMYVRIHMRDTREAQAIFVPQRAVRQSVDGKQQLLVVDENHIAVARNIRTGGMYGSEWHIVEGLAVGEKVVIGGSSSIVSGSKVTLLDGAVISGAAQSVQARPDHQAAISLSTPLAEG